MSGVYKFFDSVAEFLTRLPIVIIILLSFMGYRYYEVDTLFLRWLPIEDSMTKIYASRLISIVFVWSTLIFMVNAFRIGHWVKVVLILISFVINLYFWQVWIGDWVFKVFISAVNAAFDFGFAYLFHLMRKDSKYLAEISEVKAKLDRINSELSAKSKRLELLDARHEHIASNIKKYEAELSKVQCQNCGRIFPTPQALNAHKPNQCKKLPS